MQNLTSNNANFVKDLDEVKISVAQHMAHITSLQEAHMSFMDKGMDQSNFNEQIK